MLSGMWHCMYVSLCLSPLFIWHQAGYSPSFSSLVEAGLKEQLVYNENKGMDCVGQKWRLPEKAVFSD